MSPFGSGSVLNLPGTSTGVPAEVVQGFQSSFLNPKRVVGMCSRTTSTPSASCRSGAISPEQHVRLDHLDWRPRRIQTQRLAQEIDRVDVHAGGVAPAQVERDQIRLPVLHSAFDAFA